MWWERDMYGGTWGDSKFESKYSGSRTFENVYKVPWHPFQHGKEIDTVSRRGMVVGERALNTEPPVHPLRLFYTL